MKKACEQCKEAKRMLDGGYTGALSVRRSETLGLEIDMSHHVGRGWEQWIECRKRCPYELERMVEDEEGM